MITIEKQSEKVQKKIISYNKWANRLGYMEVELVVQDNGDGITKSFTNSKGQVINTYGNGYKLSHGCTSYAKNFFWQMICDMVMKPKWNKLHKLISDLSFIDHQTKRDKHVYGEN